MKYTHKNLGKGRWHQFSLMEQLANVGSEVNRTIAWKDKNPEYSRMAFERALELLDLTISDPKNKGRLKELLRMREVLADYFLYDNIYQSDDKFWQNYFFNFAYTARKRVLQQR